jgi:Na+-transporting methylmalonyl-CoA/oxaloacetate decarboxylase gamma subunit
VLCTLAVLIVVFYAFGAIVSKATVASQKKAKQKEESKAPAKVAQAPAAKATTPAAVPQNGVTGEVVAAISAAVYAVEGQGAVISAITPVATPVRKANPITTRNPWAQAAVIDNTRPF